LPQTILYNYYLCISCFLLFFSFICAAYSTCYISLSSSLHSYFPLVILMFDARSMIFEKVSFCYFFRLLFVRFQNSTNLFLRVCACFFYFYLFCRTEFKL
jgi:hypothetical protein